MFRIISSDIRKTRLGRRRNAPATNATQASVPCIMHERLNNCEAVAMENKYATPPYLFCASCRQCQPHVLRARAEEGGNDPDLLEKIEQLPLQQALTETLCMYNFHTVYKNEEWYKELEKWKRANGDEGTCAHVFNNYQLCRECSEQLVKALGLVRFAGLFDMITFRANKRYPCAMRDPKFKNMPWYKWNSDVPKEERESDFYKWLHVVYIPGQICDQCRIKHWRRKDYLDHFTDTGFALDTSVQVPFDYPGRGRLIMDPNSARGGHAVQ